MVEREPWTTATILAAARAVWGDDRMPLPEIAVCAAVVVGDLARTGRDRAEGRPVDLDRVATELGNLIVSAVRWADGLGLPPDLCVDRALETQRAYVAQRQGEEHGN